MSDDQKKEKLANKILIICVVALVVFVTIIFVFPSKITLELNESSTGKVWAKDSFYQSFRMSNDNYNITINKADCRDDGFCYYGKAFLRKVPDFCKSKPFDECEKNVYRIIENGNFRQQASELNMTDADLQKDGCYDNGKFAHCKSPLELKNHLVGKGIIKERKSDQNKTLN